MLHVPETYVPRSRFPVIDFHTHITGGSAGRIQFSMDPANCLAVMDHKNIRTMVDLTGGTATDCAKPQPGCPKRIGAALSCSLQPRPIEDAHKAGAQGLKIVKTLSLYLRERGTNQFVRIDDSRFDPDVGGGRRSENAGGYPHLRSRGFLPADRPLQRALGGVACPSELVFPRKRLSEQSRASGGAAQRHAAFTLAPSLCASTARTPRICRMFPECLDSHPNMNVDIAAASVSWAASRACPACFSKPDPTMSAETNELWKWDVAEVFIGSDFENIRRYREFEISPQGEWVDLDIDLDAPRHEDGWVWNSGFKVSARIDSRNQDLVRLHADPVLIRGRPPARQREYPENQFLSLPGRASKSEGARVAAHPAKLILRAGGL